MPNINFSVSHTDATVVVAASADVELGIDIECVDQDIVAGVIDGFSHTNEQKSLRCVPPHLKAREFIRLWTQKEAYTKLLGCGHTLEFSSIECSAVGGPADPRGDLVRPAHFESFYVPVEHSLYHVSLAIENPDTAAQPIDIRLINVIGPGESNGA